MNESEVINLNNARSAFIAFELFKPFLEKERTTILSKLKSEFRSNNHNLSVYMGLLSTLVSLDDLEAKMLRAIKSGNSPSVIDEG